MFKKPSKLHQYNLEQIPELDIRDKTACEVSKIESTLLYWASEIDDVNETAIKLYKEYLKIPTQENGQSHKKRHRHHELKLAEYLKLERDTQYEYRKQITKEQWRKLLDTHRQQRFHAQTPELEQWINEWSVVSGWTAKAAQLESMFKSLEKITQLYDWYRAERKIYLYLSGQYECFAEPIRPESIAKTLEGNHNE